MELFAEFLKTLIIGIIQGITEWLPISSTAHLILFNAFFPLDVSNEFWDLFSVAIQFGSILAVVIIYYDRLIPLRRGDLKNGVSLWLKILTASLPVAVTGLFLDDLLDGLLYDGKDAFTVSVSGAVIISSALIIYGALFIITEKLRKAPDKIFSVGGIGYARALGIGFFEALAVIPGTSRSGSTILGARLLGVSRPAAAEFSFFAAIPAMLGACLLRGVKFAVSGIPMTPREAAVLAVGFLVSFLVSVISVKFLTGFIRKHTFVPFGIYRIILGTVISVTAILK